MTNTSETSAAVNCYHCGEPCKDEIFVLEEKSFCCAGCKMVFEILNSNDLCNYYDLEKQPGITLKGRSSGHFAFLDDLEVQEKLIQFKEEHIVKITFFFPQIHCSSCIWLLENLYKLNDGVLASRVNFLKKQGVFTFDSSKITLRQLVELLHSIGYEPSINLSELNKKTEKVTDRSLYYKLGVAGFAFGNIMLLSFPEYLGLNQNNFQHWFGYINVLLSIPVITYCARDYMVSAWYSIRQGKLNMDVPIALGIIALFSRSLFEIFSNSGAGYLDSLAGLIFFLLTGKWFQQKTYYALNFERDYTSYFPIAVSRKESGKWVSVPLNKVLPGDLLLIRHHELIPTDGILTKGEGQIDYSFVTGEADPVSKLPGDKLFAGGKQMGSSIELTVTRAVEQSYLTQLWNESTFSEQSRQSKETKLSDFIGRNFTITILIVAFTTLFYWIRIDPAIAVNAFTSVLIIACPCAIALSIPFTYGNVLRFFGRFQFYLKNILVIEAIQNARIVVFDKTGTLTETGKEAINYIGNELTGTQKSWIKSLTASSIHPLSRKISDHLKDEADLAFNSFEEIPGKGILGTFGENLVQLGSAAFVENPVNEPGVHIAINGTIIGYFSFSHPFRKTLPTVVQQLREKFELFLLSGDTDRESSQFLPYFQDKAHLIFNQSPKDKLVFIKTKQQEGKEVIMIGDGLNDAGALKQSEVGIVVTEHINNFTPASDAILAAEQFGKLPALMKLAKASKSIIYSTYLLALVYNIVGLSFAVQGNLSPVIAAILMPLSSITVVVWGVGISTLLGNHYLRSPKK